MHCEHQACNCPETMVIRNGLNFCSEACAAEGAAAGAGPCPCGHEGCRQETSARGTPPTAAKTPPAAVPGPAEGPGAGPQVGEHKGRPHP